MHKEAQEELRDRLKLAIIEFADQLGVTKACQEFNVPRASFYRWKQKYEKAGRSGLYRERRIAYHHPRGTPAEVVEKILTIRGEHQFGYCHSSRRSRLNDTLNT
jgi:hypothetical protein